MSFSIPVDQHTGNVVRDFGHHHFGGDAFDGGDLRGNVVEAALPFGVERVVIFGEVEFERFDHADDFFLADFLACGPGRLRRGCC